MSPASSATIRILLLITRTVKRRSLLDNLSFACGLEKNWIHEPIAVRATPLYTLSHVIGLSGLPDRCVDLLSVSRICVLWHREASDLKL